MFLLGLCCCAADDECKLNRVNEVYPDKVVYSMKDPETGETISHDIPTNFVLWSTGIAMNPFTQRVSDLLPNQVHRKVSKVSPASRDFEWRPIVSRL